MISFLCPPGSQSRRHPYIRNGGSKLQSPADAGRTKRNHQHTQKRMFRASICSRSRAKVNEQEQIEFILFHLVPPVKRIVCNCCIAPSPVRRIEPHIRCCKLPPYHMATYCVTLYVCNCPAMFPPKCSPNVVASRVSPGRIHNHVRGSP